MVANALKRCKTSKTVWIGCHMVAMVVVVVVVVVVMGVVVYCSANTSHKRSELRGAERAATLFKNGGPSFGSEGATSCNYCLSNLHRNCLLPLSFYCCASEQARSMEWLLPLGPCSTKFKTSQTSQTS